MKFLTSEVGEGVLGGDKSIRNTWPGRVTLLTATGKRTRPRRDSGVKRYPTPFLCGRKSSSNLPSFTFSKHILWNVTSHFDL